MHILLTRPLEDCSQMILKFQSLGHQVSHLPLLNISKINYSETNFSNFKGIVFTSANAIKFLNTNSIDKKLLCFCVGDNTEKKARAVGFQNVIAAEGNVANLKEMILKNLDKKDGDIVYVYSQNSALSFLKFIKFNQSENLWMNTNLMCIGEKTSAILNEIKWKKIFLFNPGEEEFLLYKI